MGIDLGRLLGQGQQSTSPRRVYGDQTAPGAPTSTPTASTADSGAGTPVYFKDVPQGWFPSYPATDEGRGRIAALQGGAPLSAAEIVKVNTALAQHGKPLLPGTTAPSWSTSPTYAGLPDVDLGQFVRDGATGGSGQPAMVDVTRLLTRVPVSSGFYTRLANNTLTANDRQLAAGAIGGDLTPTLRDDILRQMVSMYTNQPGPGGLPGAARAAGQWGSQPAGMPTVGGIAGLGPQLGVTPGAARPGAVPQSTPAPGFTGGVPATPAAPGAAPGAAPAPTLRETGTASGEYSTGDADRGYTSGRIAPRAPMGAGVSIVRDPTTGTATAWSSEGKPIGRAKKDAAGNDTGEFEFTADPTDANLALAAQSGLFSASELTRLRSDVAKPLQVAKEWEWKQADLDFKGQQLEIESALAERRISLEEAKLRVDTAVAEMNARKTAADIETMRLNNLLFPLTQREKELGIAESELKIQIEQAMFPLDYATKEEQLFAAQQQRMERERKVNQDQANSGFMQGAVPGMLRLLGGKGNAGGQTQPNTEGASGNPIASAAPGPPPIYQQMAERAGVQPGDPAAMLAWTALLQNVIAPGVAGGQPNTPLAPTEPGTDAGSTLLA
jgi:hypothetical protein